MLRTARHAPAHNPVMSGKLDEIARKLPDLGLSSTLRDLPEPVRDPIRGRLATYSSQPGLFAGDAAALLLSAGLNPLGAFPYWLSYFAVADDLGAYGAGATSDYKTVVEVLLKASAAATVGGLLLCVPGDLLSGNSFTPFYIVGCLGKFVGTATCLGGVRGFQVYEKTGKLPELPG